MHSDAVLDNIYLKSLGERVWPRGHTAETDAYRFSCYPTFTGPTVLRIEVAADGSGRLITKVADGQCGYSKTGKIVFRDRVWLTRNQVKLFRKLLSEVSFQPFSRETTAAFTGLDGEGWYLESYINGNYQVISRWSPTYHLTSTNNLADIRKEYPNADVDGYLKTNKALVELVRLMLSWSELSDRPEYWKIDVQYF